MADYNSVRLFQMTMRQMEFAVLVSLVTVSVVASCALLAWIIFLCCTRCGSGGKHDVLSKCICCSCVHNRRRKASVQSAIKRILYPTFSAGIANESKNGKSRSWYQMGPPSYQQTLESGILRPGMSSSSSESSDGKQPIPADFEFLLFVDNSSKVTLKAIRLYNLLCSAPKFILYINIMVSLPCCECSETSPTKPKMESESLLNRSDSDVTLKDSDMDMPQDVLTSTPEFSENGSCQLDMLEAEKLETDTSTNSTHSSDLEPTCPNCHNTYSLISVAEFYSRTITFKNEIPIGEKFLFDMDREGPFWIEASLLDREDRFSTLAWGRSKDLFRQNYALKSIPLFTTIMNVNGSVLVSIKYLPISQKMTITLLETKNIDGLVTENSIDIYMKSTLLHKGRSSIRVRSHGPRPNKVHDETFIWTGHSTSFDIPDEWIDKVTLVIELILKTKGYKKTHMQRLSISSKGYASSVDSSPITSPLPIGKQGVFFGSNYSPPNKASETKDVFYGYDSKLDSESISKEIAVPSYGSINKNGSCGSISNTYGVDTSKTSDINVHKVPSLLLNEPVENKLQPPSRGRIRLGRIVIGKDAMTYEGREHWSEALENSRMELMYWHELI